ncbi:hypothetical protein O181_124206 [Austropuccinia psidii MF-1]|uniref:Uncharacterized protein n=1 Tax=Austropuccinia psidii MF-1 TaxID=1389203 RepID=A0A9Q3KPZ5_9BASI|nr:hypothetical protein [Austropuccinia psidii MF-1]
MRLGVDRSSDGSTILTEATNWTIRLFHRYFSNSLFDLHHQPHANHLHSLFSLNPCVPAESHECAEDKCSWNPVRQFPMADSLLSTCWFPYSSLHDPSQYCFVAAVKDHPIQLLDASDGRIRASYPIVDHTDMPSILPHQDCTLALSQPQKNVMFPKLVKTERGIRPSNCLIEKLKVIINNSYHTRWDLKDKRNT